MSHPHANFGGFYVGFNGPLILELWSGSPNLALVQNHSHSEPEHSVGWALEERQSRAMVGMWP